MIILFWQVMIADWKPTTKLLCQHVRWKLYCLDTLIHSTAALFLSTTFSWLFHVKNTRLVLRLLSCFASVCLCVCVYSSANITCASLRHYVTMPL